MPNWVDNDMSFAASSREELESLWSILWDDKKQEPTFAKLFKDYKPDRDDWYEWNLENIGSKWEPNDVIFYGIERDKSVKGPRKWKMNIGFMTAWSPPLGIMPVIAEKFPKIRFSIRYDEPGMSFRGHEWWNNGEKTKDVYTEY